MSDITAIHWLATAETVSLKLCITVALNKRYLLGAGECFVTALGILAG